MGGQLPIQPQGLREEGEGEEVEDQPVEAHIPEGYERSPWKQGQPVRWFMLWQRPGTHSDVQWRFGKAIRELPWNKRFTHDAWLEGICDFFEQLGRSGLAELARALVQTERAEREETNRAMTRKTAEAVVRRQIVMNGKKRRRKMEELLGENDDEGDDEPTPGPTSPN